MSEIAFRPEGPPDGNELLGILWRYRRSIAICSLFFAVLLAVVAFNMKPVFRGAAILVPADTNRNGMNGSLGSGLGAMGGLAALAGVSLGGQSQIEESLAVLKSRQFTESFISKNNLMPELFSEKWDAKSGTWRVPADEQPTLNRAFKVFDRLRSISRDAKTGLITLQVDWTDREKAVDWTMKLVDQLNDEMRARAIKDAQASLGYLQKELTTANEVPTREAISRLMEAQIKQRMMANVTQEYSLRFVDRPILPDKTEKVAPRKALMIAVGLVFGFVLGASIAMFHNGLVIARKRSQ